VGGLVGMRLGVDVGMHALRYDRTDGDPASIELVVDPVSSFGFIPGAPERAPVAELVDAPDSKSGFLTDGFVGVRPGEPDAEGRPRIALCRNRTACRSCPARCAA